MLATLAQEVPEGEGWLFEVKWDGYRALAYVDGGEARLVSRNGNDLTARFPQVAKELAKAVKTPDCVLDGEVCALDEEGRPSFSAMQQGKPGDADRLRGLRRARGRGRAARRSAADRAAKRLEALLDRRNTTVRLSEAFEDGKALYKAAKEQGLEGVIAKRCRLAVQAGQAHARLAEDQDARPAGVRDRRVHEGPGPARGPPSARSCSGSGAAESLPTSATAAPASPTRTSTSCSRSCGRWSRRSRRSRSSRRCRRCGRATSSGWSRSSSARSSSSSGRTTGGCARPPSRGCARTRRPGRCTARSRFRRRSGRASGCSGSRTSTRSSGREGITKGDLLAYYRAVAPVLVPHIRDRPFTMKRYPDGIEGGHFFQKDAPKHMPEWIPTRRVRGVDARVAAAEAEDQVPLVNDELALLWMVNMGCIDLNTWYSRVDKPDRPDFVLFDLDPPPTRASPRRSRSRCSSRRCWTRSASSPSRRRAAARACTSSSRSSAGTPTRRRASSPRSSPARSPARTAGSSRPSGRRRSGAAC